MATETTTTTTTSLQQTTTCEEEGDVESPQLAFLPEDEPSNALVDPAFSPPVSPNHSQSPTHHHQQHTSSNNNHRSVFPSTSWKPSTTTSLSEVYATVPVRLEQSAPCCRKLMSFTGIGVMVSVGYMDPGNWATDVAAGAGFGYILLCMVLVSSLMAMLLQYLSLKLGVATDRDLAMAIHDAFHPKIVFVLWIIMEIAIAATDMAEILGAAVALYLLTGLPLPAGVAITFVDVFLILFVQNGRIRVLEVSIAILTAIIFLCLCVVVGMASPDWGQVFFGLVPQADLFQPNALFLGIGIVGATVMPHNLFLHGAVVQSRNYERTVPGRTMAIRYASIDSHLSLSMAFLVNAMILIMAGAAFHAKHSDTQNIFAAYQLLSPAIGAQAAGTLFALALLSSGQQASLTGTLAGQIIMEGMVRFTIAPWKRRLGTRLVAMIPAVVMTAILGEGSIKLLIISQVVLSITLPFAAIPLVMFTSDVNKMGKEFVNGPMTKLVSWVVVLFIMALNLYVISLPQTWVI